MPSIDIDGSTIRAADNMPLPRLRVEAWDKDLLVDDFLAVAVTDEQGAFRMSIAEARFQELGFDRKPDLFFKVYQDKLLVHSTERSVLWNVADPTTQVRIEVPLAPDSQPPAEHVTYRIAGQVMSQTSAGVGGLLVRVVDKAVGGDVELARTTTDNEGAYQTSFAESGMKTPGKTKLDLQVQVRSNGVLLAASSVRYGASTNETLNVLLPGAATPALRSEHETLLAAISVHYKGNLGALDENDERQDITYLAQKTGWDARAVAMTALAEQFSARAANAGASIPTPLFYALFRAGLTANEATLYRASPATVESIWKQAIAKKVVPAALEGELPGALRAFQSLAGPSTLSAPASLGLSSSRELLSVSIGDDSAGQQAFVELRVQHRGDLPRFWEAVKQRFGDGAERRLRLDGKLAFLTLNNAPLIRRLHASAPNGVLTEARQLVAAGYFRVEAWQAIIDDDAIPPEISGADGNERRVRYAEQLAAEVRLSFPTAVVAESVRRGEVLLGVEALRQPVHAFLSEHEGSFNIDREPVRRYLARNGVELTPAVAQEITTIQRVRQITLSDEAGNALRRHGLDSALAVSRYERDQFVKSFKDEMGGEELARLTHAKAQQVHRATLNLAVSYLTAGSAPGVGVHSPAQIIDPSPLQNPHATDVIAYPTLEGLLGELDYCACEHCRSVLSPAAYLVDLLHFMDRDDWSEFVSEWRDEHRRAGEDEGPQYPFLDTETWESYWHAIAPDGPPPNTEIRPLDVLLSRRPDIQHLPLTCENTNTPLPYINLVNETLEYFVAHNFSLEGYSGQTTDDGATVEELLASPMFVSDVAYEPLATAKFPPPLPFHQPLETLRRHFTRFGTSLPEVMRALRRNDERENAGDYGWLDIALEEVRMSRSEYALLTDRALTLQELYGFPEATPEADVVSELSRARAFARRLDISYEDLVRVLTTRFVNPSSALLSSNPEAITSLITLTNPVDPGDVCTFEHLELHYADSTRSSLRATDFVRLLRFIRLWRRLGFSIEHTDKAITDLYPVGIPDGPELERLDAAFAAIVPRLAVIRRAMNALGLDTKDLLPLLACFAPLETHDDRHGWLAQKLKLSVRELMGLIGVTGLDPFALPDLPAPGILRLIDLVQQIRASGLTVSQALYLIWNEDISGRSVPEPDEIFGLARGLRSDFVAVEAELAISDDPDGRSAREKVTLVYGATTAETFFGFLDGTVVLEVTYTHSVPALHPAVTTVDPALGYDDFAHRLSHRGLLDSVTEGALRDVPGVTATFQDAVGRLFSRSEDVKNSFFALHPELRPIFDAYTSSGAPLPERRAALIRALVPELSRRRKRQQAIQHVVAATGVVLAFGEGVLDPPARADGVYPLHAVARVDQPALEDVLALETRGLAVHFSALGSPDLRVPSEANLDYSTTNGHPLPAPAPGTAISAVFSGTIEAPESGFHNFVVETDTGATVSLTLNGETQELTRNDRVLRNTQPIELVAGAFYELVVTVEEVREAVSIKWEAPTRARETIPSRYLYPPSTLEAFRETYVRFAKIASLAPALGLDAPELAHVACDADLRVESQSWLNRLPVTESVDESSANALLRAFRGLLAFARIKASLEEDAGRLLRVLEDPLAATSDANSLFFILTGWEKASLDALIDRFRLVVTDLSRVEAFGRVFDALAWTRKLGVSAQALIESATTQPSAENIRNFQAALRARYSQADWLAVIKPINDDMRRLQRDALVAYILQGMRNDLGARHIDTPEKLFEYFLMDVQMDACMQTSRVRHALSSVQLFIDRCFLNLEPRVAPSALNAEHWAWMKNYRVWEANRKVFLFPENWLEPELRDDQSPIFKETMNELLQGDITDDTAQSALLDYLSKLAEVAKLEPCGTYYEEGDTERGDVVHVVARTPGAGRKYFYRRREGGSWTPWDPIKLDIEDNPVIPVVWNRRLLLFWVRILKEVPLEGRQLPADDRPLMEVRPSSLVPTGAPRITPKCILCWSEYYNGKWQPTKTSDVGRPMTIRMPGQIRTVGLGVHTFEPLPFHRSNLSLWATKEGVDGALRISVVHTPRGFGASSFRLYNTHGTPEHTLDLEDSQVRHRFADTEGNLLSIGYAASAGNAALEHRILVTSTDDLAVTPAHEVEQVAKAPFFYSDPRHAFYVRTRPLRAGVDAWEDSFPVPFENAPAEIGDLVLPPVESRFPPAGKLPTLPEAGEIIRFLPGNESVRFGNRFVGPTGSGINGFGIP